MNNKLESLRHSASHIMAQAVLRLFPGAKLGIGPAIEDGFYYDFDLKEKISEGDLDKIQKEMSKICREDNSFEKSVVSKKEAESIFKNQPFKLQLLDNIPADEEVSIYKNGEFLDLCKGPHLKSTGELKNFKLTHIAGAYWKGNEENPMLTRIYGTAFFTGKELRKYLKQRELAKKRDHRKLGKELDLFSIHPQYAGPGLVYWHPAGSAVRSEIENFWITQHRKYGYDLVHIPHIAKSDLWKTSGHLDYYKENMFPAMDIKDGGEYILKPMNCPGHIVMYKNSLHSYRQMPVKWAELGTVYRYEKPGVLHGLIRVRGFTQDDAHIFCRPSQIDCEIEEVLKFTLKILKTFGFDSYEVFLSTRPEKYVGSDENWEIAEGALKKALEKERIDYNVDTGEGVFYGPKIDIKIKDSLGRLWQCSTIQVDFNIPQKFDLEYIGEDGNKKRPVMIHRAVFGSLERFFAILIEHYGGRFPLWLAPVQLEIIPVGEKHFDYSLDLMKKMRMEGIRAEVNLKDEKLGKKIWFSRKKHVPYMAVIGDKEIQKDSVSLRKLGEGESGLLKTSELLTALKREINRKQ
ncbi:MAG: threonine--tRNA ligase [Elusimicrobiota bacterium]